MDHIATISRKFLSDLREKKESQILSQDLERKTQLIKSDYGTLDNFLSEFNPDHQVMIVEAKNLLWLSGDFPTLALINTTYGSTASVQWLSVQLFNLSEYCGCKEKFTEEQILECARIINANYYNMKITEFMKFFFDMKSGRYGKFYGSLDPMVVTTALRDFIADRNYQLMRLEQEKENERREESAKNAITYDEYLRRKNAAQAAQQQNQKAI